MIPARALVSPSTAQSMDWRQIAAVAVCVALNGLDGFDVLAISFAAPGIAAEWGIDRAMLGCEATICFRSGKAGFRALTMRSKSKPRLTVPTPFC